MAKTTDLKPTVKNFNYSLFRGNKKYSVVEDNAVGDIHPGVKILSSSGTTSFQYTFEASGLIVVNYTVPYIGDDQRKSFLTGVNEFYNSVVGSALQTTDISVADLAAYIVLTHEWRAVIKDMDRVLSCYNQTSLLNPVYGSQLINAMTGDDAGYEFIRSNSAQLVEIRDLLAEKINTKFPVVKGSLLGAYDDMMLDNVYCDDPDAKSALIVAKRDMYHIKVSSNPLIKLTGTDFWSTIIAAWSDNEDFTGILSNLIDEVTQDSWYTDVRPYIENLIRKGGLQLDAGIKAFDSTALNKSWAPVYSTDIINLIKCSTIVGLNRNLPVSNSWFYENEDGLFSYNNMFQCFAIDSERYVGNKYYYKGKVVAADGKIVNLHSYPYDQRELDLAIVGTPYISANVQFESSVRYAAAVPITLSACCGGVITCVSYISVDGSQTALTSNILLVVTEAGAHDYTDEQKFGVITAGDLNYLQQFNSLPFMVYWNITSDAMEAYSYVQNWLEGTTMVGDIFQDIDNLVELPIAALRAAYHRFAYEAVYEGGSAKVVSPSK